MPSLYKGNTKIKDRTNYGVYKGSTPIYSIFKGSQVVYQFHPYNPNDVLVNITSGTSSITLPRGTYYIEIVGAGGAGSWVDIYGYTWFSAAGGAGGRFSCNLSTKTSVTLDCTCGVITGGASYIDIGSTRIATANGGGNGSPNDHGGYGGTVTYTTPTGITLSNVSTVTGNNGTMATAGGSTGGASVATSGTYGKGANASYGGGDGSQQNGWVYIKYVGAAL